MMANKMNFENQLDYSKYFPHFGNALFAGLAILIMFLVGLSAAILIYKNKLTKKIKILLLSISLLCGGILFGGFPNVIYLTGLTFLILGISLFFGRVFCGYICPLGAGQELVSMARFKTNLIYEKQDKETNTFVPIIVRWIFFGGFIALILIWGFEILTPLNPLNGFLLIWFPLNFLFLIALILLLAVIIASIFFYRPFCRYICPFGAIVSLLGRFNIIKIRRTDACLDCGLCEKICPTLQGFRKSKKGECYLCYRCVEFCSNEMFIDPHKIAEIKRYLSTFTLNFDVLPKEKFLDKTIIMIIQLFVPKKRMRYFNEFIDALEGNSKFFNDAIQNIVERLKEIFSDEIKNIDRKSYEAWINKNEPRWREKIQPIHLDKLIYGLSKQI